MKKILSVILFICLAVFSSCENEQPVKTYTVAISSNGMEPQLHTVVAGDTFVVPELKREGYTLSKITSNIPNLEIKVGDKLTVSSNIVLNYEWTKNVPLIRVTFKSADRPDWYEDYPLGTIFTAPDITREGYICKGLKYNYEIHKKETQILVDRVGIEITYEWTKVAYLKVMSDGKELENKSFTVGEKYTIPSFSKEGYHLDSLTADGVEYHVGDIITMDENYVLTCNWLPECVVTIESMGDGPRTLRVCKGQKIYASDIYKSGCSISKIISSDGSVYDQDDYILVDKDVKLSYLWQVCSSEELFDYETLENGINITRYKGTEKNVQIPSAIGDCPVISIGADAFKNCLSIESITIPATVKVIGREAFANCLYLKSISIPNSVVVISDGMFYNCSSLGTAELSESITDIPAQLFYNCTALESIVIQSDTGIKTISREAFYKCTSLTSVAINSNVDSIGSSAFYDCSSLSTVSTLKIQSISSYAFSGCKNLIAFEIPEGMISIGDHALKDCVSISNFVIPCSVTEVGAFAFENWTDQQTITVETNTDMSQWNSSFLDASASKTIFGNCVDSDYDIKYANGEFIIMGFKGADSRIEVPGKIHNVNCSIGDSAFKDNQSLEEVYLSYGLNSIGKEAFANCQNLEIIQLPDSLKSIGTHAFTKCSKLKSLVIPENVSFLGGGIISYCPIVQFVVDKNNDNYRIWNGSLYDQNGRLVIGNPNSPTYRCNIIGEYAFEGCHELKSIIIPSSLWNIEKGAFADCPNIETIDIDNGDNQGYRQRFDMYKGFLLDMVHSKIYACINYPDVIVPDGVNTIPERLFANRQNLKSVDLVNIRDIEDGAFENCTGITNLKIKGTSNSYIGERAFDGWLSTQTIEITSADRISFDPNWNKGCEANIVK